MAIILMKNSVFRPLPYSIDGRFLFVSSSVFRHSHRFFSSCVSLASNHLHLVHRCAMKERRSRHKITLLKFSHQTENELSTPAEIGFKMVTKWKIPCDAISIDGKSDWTKGPLKLICFSFYVDYEPTTIYRKRDSHSIRHMTQILHNIRCHWLDLCLFQFFNIWYYLFALITESNNYAARFFALKMVQNSMSIDNSCVSSIQSAPLNLNMSMLAKFSSVRCKMNIAISLLCCGNPSIHGHTTINL